MRRHPIITAFSVFFALIIALGAAAAASGHSGLTTAASSPVAKVPAVTATPLSTQSPKKVRHTIEYVVTGAPAMISFGVNGAEQGDVPMHLTRTFHPNIDDTYEIIAMQTSAGVTGTTKIKILVDGKVMAHATASTEHKTATVSITRLFGSWSGDGWAA